MAQPVNWQRQPGRSGVQADAQGDDTEPRTGPVPRWQRATSGRELAAMVERDNARTTRWGGR